MHHPTSTKILILGGDGMLGHQLWRHFSPRYDTAVTLRREFDAYRRFGLFDPARAYAGVDVRQIDRLTEVFAEFRPDVVLNGVGIVKQRQTSKDAILSLEVNALLPHRLAVLCAAAGAKLIHPSTDCVFSGAKGGYSEDDSADATDMYGRTKYLGEVGGPHALTLRTSIIGFELDRKASLVEWFLHAPDPVKGFKKAIFSGLTTRELSKLIEALILEHPDLTGVHQVSSDPISKYELLSLINDRLGLHKTIEPDESFVIDRSLRSDRFRQLTGYSAPSWPQMIEELAEDAHRVG